MNKPEIPEGNKNDSLKSVAKPRFTTDDWGWVVLSIGMGIGAGIAMVPIPVRLCGIWIFMLVGLIGYPAIYIFQKMYIDVMCESDTNLPYSDMLSRYLGKKWGTMLGFLYFLMLIIWFFVYTELIVRDSASYLVTLGLLKTNLSDNFFYVFGLIAVLMLIASQGVKLLFKVGTFLTLTNLLIILALGLLIIPFWSFSNTSPPPSPWTFSKKGLWLLPFALTSILFIQSLSPMVVFFRNKSENKADAQFRSRRVHKIAFLTLFSVIFVYIMSFSFTMTEAQAQVAYNDNISALALLAQMHKWPLLQTFEVTLETCAILASFFSIFIALHENLNSMLSKALAKLKPELTNERFMNILIAVSLIVAAGTITLTDTPILMFTSICSPIFGIIGCLIPAWMVYKLPHLKKYRGAKLVFIVIIGILLCLSPLAALLIHKKDAPKIEKDKIENVQPKILKENSACLSKNGKAILN